MELAKVTWPQYVDRPDFKSTFRIIAKNCMISKIYGRGNESLAKQADVPVSQVADMERALFSNWKDVARYRAHKMNYLKTTGNMETYLGDRLRGDKRMFYTTAVNWVQQGNTAVIANEAFENAIMHIRAMGIDILAEAIVHDSNTNDLPIADLFEADLCYRRYFRQYIRERYGIDFKYDLDLSKDSCNNMSYYLDMETRICSIEGNKEDVDYVMSYLEKQDIEYVEDIIEDQHCDPIGDFFEFSYWRPHLFCDLPFFIHDKRRSVKFRVNRKIQGEELFGKPIGEAYFFNNVKTWNEHLVPGFGDKEECNDDGDNLEISNNPNKIWGVDEMDRILRKDRGMDEVA